MTFEVYGHQETLTARIFLPSGREVQVGCLKDNWTPDDVQFISFWWRVIQTDKFIYFIKKEI